MNAITAELVLLPEGLTPHQVVLYEDSGQIIEVIPQAAYSGPPAKSVPGILSPGFINAHCHLELSHLKGLIPQHTGMVGFILALQKVRGQVSANGRQIAIMEAAQEMFDRGIQAVGDICNGTESLAAKQAVAGIHWYSFIELFSSNPKQADENLNRGKAILTAYTGQPASLTPHAPYSVSIPLKKGIYQEAQASTAPLSIHLLESQEEVDLFASQSGPFLQFYQLIRQEFQGVDYPDPTLYMQDEMPNTLPRVIWVHNTEMTAAQRDGLLLPTLPPGFFCLCPKANLYIHNRLPDPEVFLIPEIQDRICLGTDSLAGNDSLDILEEMKTLQDHWPTLSLPTLLQWATQNGARALGFEQSLGSFEPGKQPGLVQIHPIHPSEPRLLPETRTTRLI